MKKTTVPPTSQSQVSYLKHLAGIHILILISSERAGELIRQMFMNLGFTSLYLVYDVVEAVHTLRNMKMHLIVTDMDIRSSALAHGENSVSEESEDIHVSGIQFIRRLRSSPSSPAPFTPVLMLMDCAHEKEVALARDAGVNEIVLKPLEARNFCDRIISMVDNPRDFITADTYRGPCRRRRANPPPGVPERRMREIRLIRCEEMKGMTT